MSEIPPITFSIAKLDLQDRDILVLRTDLRLTAESRKRLCDDVSACLRKAGKPDAQVIILEQGLELQVLRPI